MVTSCISATGTAWGDVGRTILVWMGLRLAGLGGLGVYTDFLYLIGVDEAGDFCKFKRRALPMAAFLLMCIFWPMIV